MKKLMLAVLFFITAMIFAQDVYRLNDSTFVYPCIASDTTTSFNYVGLPLESGWSMASELDPSGTNIDAVTWWDETNQAFFTAGHHPAFGWSCDFPVVTGGAYLISAKNDFDFTVVGDSVRVVYDIAPGSRVIILPINKPEMLASNLRHDTGVLIDAVSRYNNYGQYWDTMVWNFTFPTNDFMIYPAQPLRINSSEYTVWPDDVKTFTWPSIDKREDAAMNLNTYNSAKEKKGSFLRPVKVYVHLQDLYGNELSVPQDTDKIEIFYWISGREAEVVSSKDWFFDTGHINLNGYSTTYMNLVGFQTPPQTGDILNIYPVRYNPDGTTWPISGSIYQHIIEASSSPVYLGYEALIPGSGQPLILDMENIFPVSIEANAEGTVTTVSWVDWRATSYNLYSSDDPYDEFEFVTNTTETSLQFSAAGSKKFYRVTGVYNNKKDSKWGSGFIKREFK